MSRGPLSTPFRARSRQSLPYDKEEMDRWRHWAKGAADNHADECSLILEQLSGAGNLTDQRWAIDDVVQQIDKRARDCVVICKVDGGPRREGPVHMGEGLVDLAFSVTKQAL